MPAAVRRVGCSWRLLALCAAIALAGCGQRGALYVPDKNARVVTRPAADSSGPADAPAPSSAPR
jgi:predicted small lipoprotein YifL